MDGFVLPPTLEQAGIHRHPRHYWRLKQLLLRAVSKQEKALRAKLQRQQAEDESAEEDSEEDAADGAWGRRKKAYYAGQEVQAPLLLPLALRSSLEI